jgi:hypothetical protein
MGMAMSAASSASPAAVVETRGATGTWWLVRRAPAALHRFRCLAGAALFVHFAGHLSDTVPVLAWSGVFDARLPESSSAIGPSGLGAGLSPTGLELVFGLAMLLAAAIALGVLPRVAAAGLFGISVATYRAIFPIAALDDYLANVTTLFLALIPSGCGAVFRTRRTPSAAVRGSVCGVAATTFLTAILFVYLSGGLGEFSSTTAGGRYAEIATRMIPLAFIIPVPGSRAFGVAMQLALHGYWMSKTDSVFANLILPASGLLFWGQIEDATGPRPMVDAGAIIGILCVVTAAAAEGSVLMGGRASPAIRVFADVGLLPRKLGPMPNVKGVLLVVEGGSGKRLDIYRPDGPRRRRMIAHFERNRDSDPLRMSLSSSIARRHCRQQGYWGQVGSLVWSDEEGDVPMIEFECGAGGSLANLR